MILIDDIKYSCIECIRGHRSSSCRHPTRPLVQVRSKGRPNVHANGNPNHRIAVFAEEIASDDIDDSLSPGVNGKCRNKKNPVVILKTSSKQVIDLRNGQIIGPYNEQKSKPDPSSKPPAPIINSNSFVNTTSCCSNGVSKPSKSCGCCFNKSKKNINKSKILKTYLKKHIKQQKQEEQYPKWTFIDYSEDMKDKPENDSFVPGAKDNPQHEKQVFDVVSIPSCSIPGSCICDDSCSCEGCQVHGNSNSSTNELNKLLLNDFNLDSLNNMNYFSNVDHNHLVFNTLTNSLSFDDSVVPSHHMKAQQYLASPQDLANNHSTSDTSSAETTHLTNENNISNQINEPIHLLTHSPVMGHAMEDCGKALNNYASIFAQQLNNSEEIDSPISSPCTCPPNECDCTNCETHGIINGLKLDDFFSSNFDPKLVSVLSDISTSNPLIKNEHGANQLESITTKKDENDSCLSKVGDDRLPMSTCCKNKQAIPTSPLE